MSKEHSRALPSRTCRTCKTHKPIIEFDKNRDGSYRNAQRCTECIRANPAPPWKTTEKRREHHLRYTYGLSPDDYTNLYKLQGGCCALCKKPEVKGILTGKGRDLVVDHDHETGTIRGLLCRNCNVGLGQFEDSPILLQSAIDYLMLVR